MGINIEQNIAININNVVSYAFIVVSEVDDSVGVLNGVEFSNHFLGFGSWDGCLDAWARRFPEYEV